MGKSVPAYRWALESEIDLWKGFRKALSNEKRMDKLTELAQNGEG